jgi:DNA-binding MarR family transcriptional regulator
MPTRARTRTTAKTAPPSRCDRLEQQGYVARVRDLANRRVCWVELSGAGEAVFEGLISIGRSRLVPALARLSTSDRESLARGLTPWRTL